jgi:hypothetical protein
MADVIASSIKTAYSNQTFQEDCMKRRHALSLLAVMLALLLIGTASIASAQTGGGYDLTWSTLDGGGAMFSTGGGYALGGTIGQPDVHWILAGGGYTLGGGFWGSGASQHKVYLPVVLRN